MVSDIHPSSIISWKSFWYKAAGSVCWWFRSSSQTFIASWLCDPACSHKVSGKTEILRIYGPRTNRHTLNMTYPSSCLQSTDSWLSPFQCKKSVMSNSQHCMSILNRSFYSATWWKQKLKSVVKRRDVLFRWHYNAIPSKINFATHFWQTSGKLLTSISLVSVTYQAW